MIDDGPVSSSLHQSREKRKGDVHWLSRMEPIQQFSSAVLSAIVRRQPASAARTAFAWQLAVGATLARVTTVELSDGVLIVRAADARWTQEIHRAREVVLGRLQTLLGPDAVRALSVEHRVTKT
jgi:predicted nucleic acid-binding Zn ribbon protein